MGALDDVLLYNSALTAAEIAALAGITPPNTPPTLNPIGNKSAQAGTSLRSRRPPPIPIRERPLRSRSPTAPAARCPPAPRSIELGGSFTWTPTAGQVGGHTFDVCVSDGTASDCETISVAVRAGSSVTGRRTKGAARTLVNSSGLGATNNGTLLGNPTWVAGPARPGDQVRRDRRLRDGGRQRLPRHLRRDHDGYLGEAREDGHPVPDQEGHPGRHGRLRAVAGDDRLPLRPLQLDRRAGRRTGSTHPRPIRATAPRGCTSRPPPTARRSGCT